ncbi:MAG: DUF2073 domain-containing protein, partial [Candidatus Thermoplasmatota archaeon]|nr:DUF2073 domain-containing protein [Candidatus Thermoplasmatota archaeon]
MDNGVHINLISRTKLQEMSLQEKIRFILDGVKKNHIMVLEEGLDAKEEAKLIESTMIEIDPDSFAGIEMESQRDNKNVGVIGKIFGRSTYGDRASMTVVG